MNKKEYLKKWREKHKEERKTKDALYYAENREHILKQKREYYQRTKERKKIYDTRYRLSHLKEKRAYHKKWENENRDKVKKYSKKHYDEGRKTGRDRAISFVYSAVKVGKLVSLKTENIKCVDCGARAIQYDHRDYNKPLDVEPVCQSCNIKRGPARPLTKGS